MRGATEWCVVDAPALVNSAATTDGWFYKLDLTDASAFESLMETSEYMAYLETL